MSRKPKEPIEALTKIVSERQPLSINQVREFAKCYISMRDWSKERMHDFIRANFDVSDDNTVVEIGEPRRKTSPGRGRKQKLDAS